MPREVEDALASWRDAVRRLGNSVDGDRDALEAEAQRERERFQRPSAGYVLERIDDLHAAESRRKAATPSTDPFHAAARDEMEIAKDISDSARLSDEETPKKP